MVKHILNPKKHSASGGTSVAYKSAIFLTTITIVYSIAAICAEPAVFYWWDYSNSSVPHHNDDTQYLNPLHSESLEFRTERWPMLLGLTRREARLVRRLLASIAMGALIGLERRESNRFAGIRTMSLVSLGSCLFTLSSVYGFEDGTQEWDASRVSAALPSGVGFLGGALIVKESGQIKGLTTSCGVWLSCSVGMACGGGLYFVALFGVCGMVSMLRFGPRAPTAEELEDEEEDSPSPEPSPQPAVEPMASAASISGQSADLVGTPKSMDKPLLQKSGSRRLSQTRRVSRTISQIGLLADDS